MPVDLVGGPGEGRHHLFGGEAHAPETDVQNHRQDGRHEEADPQHRAAQRKASGCRISASRQASCARKGPGISRLAGALSHLKVTLIHPMR